MSTPGQLRASLNEHSAIAAAIEGGDAPAARGAMKQHLSITAGRLEDLAKRQPGLFSP
jgi:DNA-binding FadR family transcriptional regulator